MKKKIALLTNYENMLCCFGHRILIKQINIPSMYLISQFDMTNIISSDNGISKVKSQNQTFFLLYPKNLHFEKLEYKNIFETLKKLKSEIGTQRFVLIPPNKSPNIKASLLNEMVKFIFPENEIKIFNISRITPKNRDEIKTIFEENHCSKLAGHYEYNKTYTKIKENYYWPNMKSDIRKCIKTCHSCQMNKTNFKPTKQPMEITTTAHKPFERLAIDIVGPLPLTESGNRFILTSQDDLTKFSLAFAVQDHEAKLLQKH